MKDVATKKEWLASLREAREHRLMVTLKALKFLAIGIALSMAFAAGKATAALYHPTSLHDLFMEAIKHGGYEQKCAMRRGGCPMPAVVIHTIPDENISGQFDPRNPSYIQLNTTPAVMPASLHFNMVLVHEFVHYLQWLFGELGPQSGCTEVPKIEEPAYKAGASYLAQFGVTYDYSAQMSEIAFMAAMCEAMGAMGEM